MDIHYKNLIDKKIEWKLWALLHLICLKKKSTGGKTWVVNVYGISELKNYH